MLTPFLLIGCLLAAEPSGAALKTEVGALVLQLDADTLGERKAAEDKLIKLGPAILDLLPPPGHLQNAGAAEALERIRKILQLAQAAASVEASTVTLHGRMKLSQALAEIAKQTGNSITNLPRPGDAADTDPEIAVDFAKTPFWTALDAVLDQGQLSIYLYGQLWTLQVVPRGPHELPRSGRAAIQGPMRIEPVTVLAKRELRSSSPSALSVSLEVAWEPRLQAIAIKQRMADLKIIDSNGGSLAAESPEAEKEAFPNLGRSATEMDVALVMPSHPPKEIASLKGSLRAMILGKAEVFKFGDLLKGKQEKRIAAATVTITEVRKNQDSWEVKLQLRFDEAGDALESHRNWALQNKAYLEGADGKPIQPDSMETTMRTAKEIGVGYVFAMPELPKGATFVYETPAMIITKDFPFEVKGIKMP